MKSPRFKVGDVIVLKSWIKTKLKVLIVDVQHQEYEYSYLPSNRIKQRLAFSDIESQCRLLTKLEKVLK